MKDYVWGSNSTKSNVGNLFAAVVSHGWTRRRTPT